MKLLCIKLFLSFRFFFFPVSFFLAKIVSFCLFVFLSFRLPTRVTLKSVYDVVDYVLIH